MRKGARISKCGNYRYKLWRIWDKDKPKVMFLMLNPSTADGTNDDPTIRRCIGYAKSWGYGGLVVCNLFAYRSTHPETLLYCEETLGINPIGDRNITTIFRQASKVDKIICAWGNEKIVNKLIDDRLRSSLIILKDRLYILELSKYGVPKHPLYLKKDLKPILWQKRTHM